MKDVKSVIRSNDCETNSAYGILAWCRIGPRSIESKAVESRLAHGGTSEGETGEAG